MDQKEWVQIKEIVGQALSLEADSRDSYIQEACEGNELLQARVQEQLRSIAQSEKENFLEDIGSKKGAFIADLSNRWTSTDPDKLIGRQIGPYEITRLIGEGGMGVVYRASRIDGAFDQHVAIKLIKKGVVSKATIERFHTERAILARLQHPHIAQLYDGGLTPEGIPYLIMEFIDGVPIDQWLDEHQSTTAERLALFQDVCQVVQYAHNNMIIHRDLKPQNILVDKQGHVKILDFGIAKLLKQNHSDDSNQETLPNNRFWTPYYAAPEQFSGLSTSVATDIYALGSLLYLLLSGTKPYNFDSKSIHEIEAIIKVNDPECPSNMIADSYPEKSKIQKKLRGDLDALILKAMHRQPQHRYRSVGRLLDDLQRYESGLPLKARKSTFLYRAVKFGKRHAVGVLIFLMFCSTVIYYSHQLKQERDHAQLESKKAQEVTKLITNLFQASDPNYADGAVITAHDLLDKGAFQVQKMTNQPLIQADMLLTIGQMYQNLGDYERSKPLFKQAYEINQHQYGLKDPRTLQTLVALLGSYHFLKEKAQAELLFDKIQEENLLEVIPDNIQMVFLLNERGLMDLREGKFGSAEIWHQTALERYKQLPEEEKDKVFKSLLLNNIGFSLENRAQYERALSYYRKSRATVVSEVGEHHTMSAVAFGSLSRAYRGLNVMDSAKFYNEKTLNMRLNLLGEQHEQVADSYLNAALIARKEKKFTTSEELFKQAKQIYSHTLSDSSRFVGKLQMEMGLLYLIQRDTINARQCLKKSTKILTSTLSVDHPWIKQNQRLQNAIRKASGKALN
ncbi:serine/threonine-protein kinase [Fodinibius salsisoli]|uniref:Serine/threonine protein kinase n=1 Tax=Fodinibius salsisoli TaxID=2820877 RepID=A0ABT3PQW0_9BACT|nr:serine/threonine-protein kinase [Fodinibius salsisoli]MCW9708249.1 serine/threonine protein kinase [Fodinibius salsisoli]